MEPDVTRTCVVALIAGMGAAAVFERGGETDDAPRGPVGTQLTGLSRDAMVA